MKLGYANMKNDGMSKNKSCGMKRMERIRMCMYWGKDDMNGDGAS